MEIKTSLGSELLELEERLARVVFCVDAVDLRIRVSAAELRVYGVGRATLRAAVLVFVDLRAGSGGGEDGKVLDLGILAGEEGSETMLVRSRHAENRAL